MQEKAEEDSPYCQRCSAERERHHHTQPRAYRARQCGPHHNAEQPGDVDERARESAIISGHRLQSTFLVAHLEYAHPDAREPERGRKQCCAFPRKGQRDGGEARNRYHLPRNYQPLRMRR